MMKTPPNAVFSVNSFKPGATYKVQLTQIPTLFFAPHTVKSVVINKSTASPAETKYSEQCVRMTHQPDAVRGAVRENISHLSPLLPHWQHSQPSCVIAAL